MKYIVLFMNYSTLMCNTVYKSNKANARWNIVCRTELSAAVWHSTEYLSDMHRLQYSIDTFLTTFDFEKLCLI